MVFKDENPDKISVCVTLSSNDIEALFSVRDFEIEISPVSRIRPSVWPVAGCRYMMSRKIIPGYISSFPILKSYLMQIFHSGNESVLHPFSGVEWALSATLGLIFDQVGLPYSVLNTVVPILCVCGPGCINLANILPVCNYCAKMLKNLVPETLYVRAFKFAVSRDFT